MRGMTGVLRYLVPGLMLPLMLLAAPAWAQQDDEINLKGAIDFHAHMGPDSVERGIDADDLARLAKAAGMRGMVMKNHWEPTASMVYLMRKEVPGIELFGGVTQDLAVGGINLEAVKHMANVKGGYGRVVWLPTFDSENEVKGKGPDVPVTKDGKLLPGVLELIEPHHAAPEGPGMQPFEALHLPQAEEAEAMPLRRAAAPPEMEPRRPWWNSALQAGRRKV